MSLFSCSWLINELLSLILDKKKRTLIIIIEHPSFWKSMIFGDTDTLLAYWLSCLDVCFWALKGSFIAWNSSFQVKRWLYPPPSHSFFIHIFTLGRIILHYSWAEQLDYFNRKEMWLFFFPSSLFLWFHCPLYLCLTLKYPLLETHLQSFIPREKLCLSDSCKEHESESKIRWIIIVRREKLNWMETDSFEWESAPKIRERFPLFFFWSPSFHLDCIAKRGTG